MKIILCLLALVMLYSCGEGNGGGNTGGSDSETPPPETSGLTVQWTPPATRVDGTALLPSAIQGYRVYYGTSSGIYSTYVEIAGNTTLEYTFSGLPTGMTYHFAVTAYDTAGVESGYSNEISRELLPQSGGV